VINASEQQELSAPEGSTRTGGLANACNTDSALLALAEQFEALTTELAASQLPLSEFTSPPDRQLLIHDSQLAGTDADARTKRAETILARLYPIEQAIMQTRARTIAGLGVKARHAAYVMSHHWEEPIDQIDWEAQAIRLLIEAVCDIARAPLPFRSVTSDR
jgi:hypothetical protein